MEITKEQKNKNLLLLSKKKLIGDLLEQAIGVYFLNWKEEDAPMVLNPYKYRYTDNRKIEISPKLSELLLDEEEHIDYILKTPLRNLDKEDLDTLKDLDDKAEAIWNRATMNESKKLSLKSYLEKKLTVSPKEAELIESVIKEYVRKKKVK